MQWLALGIALVICVALAVNWFANASLPQVIRALRRAAVVLALLVVLVLVLIGRLHWLIGLVGWAIPAALALRAMLRRDAAARGPRPGQSSQVRTPFLDMRLDHDSGALDGTVIAGAYEGRMLSSMSLEELRALLAEAAGDADTANVLAAYLDRHHGESWRSRDDRDPASEAGAGAAAGGTMTRDEAWRILGLEPDASVDEIRAAHRRLMKQLHPDHGGTDYLAAKINEAKDLLLHR